MSQSASKPQGRLSKFKQRLSPRSQSHKKTSGPIQEEDGSDDSASPLLYGQEKDHQMNEFLEVEEMPPWFDLVGTGGTKLESALELSDESISSTETSDTDKLSYTCSSFESNFDLFDPPKPKKSIRFADEFGKPIETVHVTERNDDYNRVLILLLNSKERKFEIIHVEYSLCDKELRVNDLVEHFAKLATNPVLSKQSFVGVTRLVEKGMEMFNASPLYTYDLGRDEVLAAIPKGCTCKESVKNAILILQTPCMGKAIKRATRTGRALTKIESPGEPVELSKARKDHLKTVHPSRRRRGVGSNRKEGKVRNNASENQDEESQAQILPDSNEVAPVSIDSLLVQSRDHPSSSLAGLKEILAQ